MTIVQVFKKESDQAMYEGLIASGMSQHDAFVHVLDGKPAGWVDAGGFRRETYSRFLSKDEAIAHVGAHRFDCWPSKGQ
mgnify:CR=1 FL=1